MTNKKRPAVIEGLEGRVFMDASQLTETILSSTLPAGVSDQATLKGTVTVQVANNSGATQKFKGSVGVYAAARLFDLTSNNWTLLRSQPAAISLVSGASRVFKIAISVPKGKLADGTYALFAAVTDQTNATSQSPAGGTLLVHVPIVSLSETEKLLKLPASTKVGATLKAVDRVTITNSGSDPFSGVLNIALLAAPNYAVVGATSVSSIAKKLTIPAGRSVTVSLNFRSESAIGPGTYHMISEVIQPNGMVTSSNPATAPTFTILAPITTPLFVDTINSASEMYAPDATDPSAQHITQLDLQMTIQNNGLNSLGTDTFTLFSSTKPTLDSTANQVTSLPLKLNIYSLDNYPFQIDFSIPGNGPGNGTVVSLYIIVQVTDTAGDVTQASYATPITFAGPIG